jgi:hypothetical protein
MKHLRPAKGFSLTVLIFLILSGLTFYYFLRDDSKKWPPGIMVESEPLQEDLSAQKVLDLNGYTIVAKSGFSGSARVLSVEKYYTDDGHDLVPVDLALGWKEMSDQSVLDQLKISQSRRFYFWKTKGSDYPVAREKIEQNSANMHMIPSTDRIKDTLKAIRKSDIIRFEGYLVDISNKDGFSRFSSTTRTDTGPGACEIVYLTALFIEKTPR